MVSRFPTAGRGIQIVFSNALLNQRQHGRHAEQTGAQVTDTCTKRAILVLIRYDTERRARRAILVLIRNQYRSDVSVLQHSARFITR